MNFSVSSADAGRGARQHTANAASAAVKNVRITFPRQFDC
jgi:hypothetical protein